MTTIFCCTRCYSFLLHYTSCNNFCFNMDMIQFFISHSVSDFRCTCHYSCMLHYSCYSFPLHYQLHFSDAPAATILCYTFCYSFMLHWSRCYNFRCITCYNIFGPACCCILLLHLSQQFSAALQLARIFRCSSCYSFPLLKLLQLQLSADLDAEVLRCSTAL